MWINLWNKIAWVRMDERQSEDMAKPDYKYTLLAHRKLVEHLEDEEDHRAIERAKKRDAGKPGIAWAEAKKRLGLA
jgi:hypothetical protein